MATYAIDRITGYSWKFSVEDETAALYGGNGAFLTFNSARSAISYLYDSTEYCENAAEILDGFYRTCSRAEINQFKRVSAEVFGDYCSEELMRRAIQRARKQRDIDGVLLSGVAYSAAIDRCYQDAENSAI